MANEERSIKKSIGAAVSSVVHSVAKVFGRGIRMSKRTWSTEEDNVIINLVKTEGTNWSLISSHLTNRSGKQCRERYYNHLQSNIKKGGWTIEEDEAIMRLNSEYGNQWVKIMKFLPGRTDNAIKNRYHAIIRAQNAADASKYVGAKNESHDTTSTVAVAQPIHLAIPVAELEQCDFDTDIDFFDDVVDESSAIHAFVNDDELHDMMEKSHTNNKNIKDTYDSKTIKVENNICKSSLPVKVPGDHEHSTSNWEKEDVFIKLSNVLDSYIDDADRGTHLTLNDCGAIEENTSYDVENCHGYNESNQSIELNGITGGMPSYVSVSSYNSLGNMIELSSTVDELELELDDAQNRRLTIETEPLNSNEIAFGNQYVVQAFNSSTSQNNFENWPSPSDHSALSTIKKFELYHKLPYGRMNIETDDLNELFEYEFNHMYMDNDSEGTNDTNFVYKKRKLENGEELSVS